MKEPKYSVVGQPIVATLVVVQLSLGLEDSPTHDRYVSCL